MKKIMRKNQIIITALVIMVAVAGYLSLANEESNLLSVGNMLESEIPDSELEDISDEDMAAAEIGQEEALAISEGAITDATEESSKDNAGEAVMVGNSVAGSYFESAKLSREQTRAKNKETLMQLANSKNATNKQKESAMNEIVNMTTISEKETATENLLAAKSFENVIVSIVEDSVDVVVDAEELTEQQIAQIADIVMRKTEVSPDKIAISPVGKKE
ncbi:MAG: SpoIIIAH-like family protein [Lachnoclostridium sp.]|nr:SpoIIIAH-like family protein [Lachnoclostridium sp.]